MNEENNIKLQDEIRSVFSNGTILSTKDDKLGEYLTSLCLEPVPNEGMRHAKIIQALTINHIQMKRHIDNLNKKNNRTQFFVILLALVSLVSSVVQIYITVTNTQPIIIQQQQQSRKLQNPIQTTHEKNISSKPPYEKNK